MLLTKEIEIILDSKTINYYKGLGYEIPKKRDKWGKLTTPRKTKIMVKIKDLLKKSNVYIDVKCDNCGEILKVKYCNYNRYLKEDGKYYCRKCSIKLYNKTKMEQTKFLKTKSFEDWCIENNRQDILLRWDYELNKYKPNEIAFKTSKKYYFKCPKGIHKSELKIIRNFTSGQIRSLDCHQCNSFAQWGIDNLGNDFLEKYWSDKNTVSPWEISFACNTKVWIKCQEKDYHEDYITPCGNFYNGERCPYCTHNNNKLHILDSLGTLYPKALKFWSDKNTMTPFEYSPYASKKVWWRCPNGEHEDYIREIGKSNISDFRCPKCQCSKGEETIECYLKIYNIKHISQKIFDDLLGLGGGNLSYDFYLPSYNLLIEYQGEFHDGTAKYQTKEGLGKQKEHDRRKKEYAKSHNIKLLEIWYWDFDNIEQILDKELINNKNTI